jgi:Fe2+ or Zn2+ uptake regulation protein
LYDELTAEMAAARGFQVAVTRLVVGGFCRRCREAGRQEKS